MGIFNVNKTFLVYGMGISGKGVARLLSSMGENIILYDKNPDIDMDAVKREVGLREDTLAIKGELTEADLDRFDILALSPGVSIYQENVKAAQAAGKKVLGEIEIAYEASKGRLAAITGTNGKTTTTTLTGEIMKAAFDDVHVVGNIGYSYAEAADKTTEKSVTVAEISSFQLESIDAFRPDVSAILNLTPDHLDRHFTFENYCQAKLLIAKNQDENDTCVINYDDEILRKLSESLKPKKLYFSRKEKLDTGIYLDGEDIMYSDGKIVYKVISRSEISLVGDHNVENVMAAIGISIAMGVDLVTIASVIRTFKAVEHRIEYVCTKKGVKYYNDSKGTNPDAAAKAVAAMKHCVLIAGGYDKHSDFTEWINGFDGHVKAMVLIGQTAQIIKDTALKCGFTNIYMAEDLAEAVAKCAELACPGEDVLLSPACASWGQFKNYEQRGRMFKDLANALPE